MNRHWRNFYPFAVFPITSVLSNLTDVDFGIKVCRKCLSVIACITVDDVEVVHFVELMLIGIGAINLRNAWVETTTQKCHQTSFFKTILICPLPAIFKFGYIFWFIVCCIQIVYACFQTSIHNGKVLVWKSYIDYHCWLETFEKLNQFRYVVGINFCRLDFYAVHFLNITCDFIAFRFCATC